MSIQWPREREATNSQSNINDSFKTEQDFHQLLGAGGESLPTILDEAVTWVVQQGGEIAELEQRITMICNQVDLQEFPDSANLLMTWVCAEALVQSPSLQTWGNVKRLKYNSWQIEHWLASAMIVRAERSSNARKAYIDLTKEVFVGLDSSSLVSLSGRYNQERVSALSYWKECRDKLDELWWGLRGWSGFMVYEEDLSLFHVLNQLDPDELIHDISQSTNPYVVHSVLTLSGAGAFFGRFEQWKKFAADAPTAFEADGTWNGSVFAPLLLVEACNQLLLAGRSIPHFNASDVDVERVKREIVSVVEAVVSTLAKRPDAIALFARWSTWLMRQMLSHSEKDTHDVRSAAFVYDALIEAIGRKLKGKSVIQISSSDASFWEAWCYRCVLASHAYGGFIDLPNSRDFLAEWTLSPDEWAEKKGQRLRERANFIVTMSKEVPGMAANLLAYPIVRADSPTEAWIGMWNATYALREIVEFGDADASADEYQSRLEAGKLLLLVFRIGLAILDQRVDQCSSSDTPVARSQAKLNEALASAVREMREIDDTLNRGEWLTAIRHLAVRRLIWEMSGSEGQKSPSFPVFCADDKPTFSDYLAEEKGNAFELLALIQWVLINAPDIPRLQSELSTASVNLTDALVMVRRLNQYSQRRYPIDELQLQKIKDLAGSCQLL